MFIKWIIFLLFLMLKIFSTTHMPFNIVTDLTPNCNSIFRKIIYKYDANIEVMRWPGVGVLHSCRVTHCTISLHTAGATWKFKTGVLSKNPLLSARMQLVIIFQHGHNVSHPQSLQLAVRPSPLHFIHTAVFFRKAIRVISASTVVDTLQMEHTQQHSRELTSN